MAAHSCGQPIRAANLLNGKKHLEGIILTVGPLPCIENTYLLVPLEVFVKTSFLCYDIRIIGSSFVCSNPV